MSGDPITPRIFASLQIHSAHLVLKKCKFFPIKEIDRLLANCRKRLNINFMSNITQSKIAWN